MEHKKRFAGLDGLRAIFCIGIVIYHVNEPLRWGGVKWLDSVYKYGGYIGIVIYHVNEPLRWGG